MLVLIKNARIIDIGSPFHTHQTDLLVKDGIIVKIAASIHEDVDKMVDTENLHVSLGWYDVWADFAEPGYGNRETLATGASAATAGGFTEIQLMPTTDPAVTNRTILETILNTKHTVRLHPVGLMCNEKGLNEMYDMFNGGAVTFSNGKTSVTSPSLLLKALQYLSPLNTPLIQVPGEKNLNGNGVIHEGIVSTQLGLPGLPSISEIMMIQRDIELVQYTKTPIHFTGVSTAKGLELIRQAKNEKLPVTCSVTAYHTVFTDEDLKEYDSNLKVFPPLRTKNDQNAIRNAIMDGTVDCIASHHLPQHQDDKLCEFEKASDGMAVIQNVFSILNTWLKDVPLLISLLTNGRNIFKHKISIDVNQEANLTLFVPDKKTVFTKEKNKSLSYNNPFINRELQGEVVGTILQNQTNLL